MNNEKDLIVEINRIVREALNIEEAIAFVQSLLDSEIGSSKLLLDPDTHRMSSRAAISVCEFLDSRQFPFRALYTAPVVVGGETVGRLVACFGSFGSPGESLQRVTAHLARQLGQLLAQTHEMLPHSEAA